MGGLVSGSLLAPALLGKSLIQSAQSQRRQSSAMRQQQKANDAVQKARLAAEDRKRKDNLKRQTSAQIARFGALGIGANDGSAAAVVAGLKTRSEADAQDRYRIRAALSDNNRLQRKQSLLSAKSNAYQNNLDRLLKFGK